VIRSILQIVPCKWPFIIVITKKTGKGSLRYISYKHFIYKNYLRILIFFLSVLVNQFMATLMVKVELL